MSSSTNISLQDKNISEPWKYNIEYSWTSKAWNSDSLISKMTRRSGLGIAFLAMVETIAEIIKIPLKFIGNQFGLYKNSFFQSKSKQVSQIDTKPTEEKTKVDEEIKPEVLNEQNLEKTKTSTWKKALVIGVGILGVFFLGAVVYKTNEYFKISETPIDTTVVPEKSTAFKGKEPQEIDQNSACLNFDFVNANKSPNPDFISSVKKEDQTKLNAISRIYSHDIYENPTSPNDSYDSWLKNCIYSILVNSK